MKLRFRTSIPNIPSCRAPGYIKKGFSNGRIPQIKKMNNGKFFIGDYFAIVIPEKKDRKVGGLNHLP